MRRALTCGVFLSLLLMLATTPTLASGFGAFVEGISGSGDVEIDWDNSGNQPPFDNDFSGGHFGFILDTNLARDSVFNYRLNVGLGALDAEDDFGTALELGGVTVDNTFGFGVVRSKSFRLWIGPQIRIGVYTG